MKKSSSRSSTANNKTMPGAQYLSEVMRELKKVDWPSREQTFQQTLLVVAVSTLVAVYLGGLDYIFTQLTSWLIR